MSGAGGRRQTPAEMHKQLEQLRYENSNLREILEAYQEHLQAARPVESNSGGHTEQIEQLQEQLSVTSSRNAVLSSEIEAQKVENKSLRDIMDAMREDLKNGDKIRSSMESEHDERLGLLSEQLSTLKKNAKRARIERRSAERQLTNIEAENSSLKERIAAQDAQMQMLSAEKTVERDAVLAVSEKRIEVLTRRLEGIERLRREDDSRLAASEYAQMSQEDIASQQAEIYRLESELSSIRQSEADERAANAVNEAQQRVRHLEQRLAQETALRQKIESERDSLANQIAILQQRFGMLPHGIVPPSPSSPGSKLAGLDESVLLEDARKRGMVLPGARSVTGGEEKTDGTCTVCSIQ